MGVGKELKYKMATTWDLSEALSLALKSTERCPVYLQFTSKKGERYGRVLRKICMFPETWEDLKKPESEFVQTLWGSAPAGGAWKLDPNWEVEIRDFKENPYVCFSQWDGGEKIPRFNMTRDEYQALLEISDEVDTSLEERRAKSLGS